MTLRRVGVLSVAKIFAVLYGGIGLIFGSILSIVSLFGAMAGAAAEEGLGAIVGAFVGVGAIIFVPLVYGVMGFLGGAFISWLYNLIAGMMGGIEMEFEAPPQVP